MLFRSPIDQYTHVNNHQRHSEPESDDRKPIGRVQSQLTNAPRLCWADPVAHEACSTSCASWYEPAAPSLYKAGTCASCSEPNPRYVADHAASDSRIGCSAQPASLTWIAVLDHSAVAADNASRFEKAPAIDTPVVHSGQSAALQTALLTVVPRASPLFCVDLP